MIARDDIIRMAVEAGARDCANPDKWDIWEIRDTDLERFAALVAAHERDRLAQPDRQWVGLTEIEIVDIEVEELTSASSETFSFARAIEYKLKEKNTPLAQPCPTCEALARTVMLDQTSHDTRRQWVGLTDQEIKSLPSWWPSYEDAPALVQLVKDVEAKLREKNEIRNP